MAYDSGDRIHRKEVADLLSRAAAALETPADLTEQEKQELVEDLTVMEQGVRRAKVKLTW